MKKKADKIGPMHQPPHPGEVLKGLYIDELELTLEAVAKKLDVDRKTISRLCNGRTRMTADMARRISRVFGTSIELWLRMQASFDAWEARQMSDHDIRHLQPLAWQPAI